MRKGGMGRFLGGAQEIFLNQHVNRIPSWTIRRAFYVMLGMKISKGARIGIGTVVKKPKGISIGERSIINENCHLDGRGGLTIGSDTSISVYSTIITATHKPDKGFVYVSGPVVIEDHVWLGAHAIVLNDSCLKSYTIIGAGCVFKGITEEKGIYIGNPAKLLKIRSEIQDYHLDYSPFFI